MAVQTPPAPRAPLLDGEIEAGVIEDARKRQQRHRRFVAALIATALAAGALIVGFAGGGGGAGTGRHAHDRGSTPDAATHVSSRPISVVAGVPGPVAQFGLLAPGVGYGAIGSGFYMTHDGGRHWTALSLGTHHGSHYGNITVPGFGLTGDITANITATASPSPSVLAIGFIDGRAGPSCKPPRYPATGAGAILLTENGGRTWNTHILPGCNTATSLSFVSARVGFAALTVNAGSRDANLYKTVDGGVLWRLVRRFGSSMVINFSSAQDGLSLSIPKSPQGAGVLYRTTNGGDTWQRSRICGPTSDPTLTVYCGEPLTFGSHGVLPAVVHNQATGVDRASIYTTFDSGLHWRSRAVPRLQSPKFPSFSAPNPYDLFLYSMNGVLHTSTDGGRHWSSIPEPGFRNLDQMQFVNADYGWILASGQFDYTTDGGRHWKPVGSR